MANPVLAGRRVGIDRVGQRQRAGDVQRARALREHVGQRHQARRELQRELQRVGREVVIVLEQQRRRAGHRGRGHAGARQHEVLRRAVRAGHAQVLRAR